MGRENKNRSGEDLSQTDSSKEKGSVLDHLLNSFECLLIKISRDGLILSAEGPIKEHLAYLNNELVNKKFKDLLLEPQELNIFNENDSSNPPLKCTLESARKKPVAFKAHFINVEPNHAVLLKPLGDAEVHNNSKLNAIFNAALDGIITIDEHGRIETVNPATCKLFMYDSSELIGQNVSMLMPEPDKRQHDQYIKNYKKTGERKIIGKGREVVGQKKDGTTFPLDLSVTEIFIGEQRTFMGMLHDLTIQKIADQRMQEYTQELEKTVRVRTTELQNTNESLQNEIAERKVIQSELIEGQKLYREIARNFPDGSISVLDRDLKYVFIDGKELSRLNLSSEKLIGTSIKNRLPEKIGNRLSNILKKVFDNRKETIEIELNHAAYLINAVPLPNAEGEINRILVVEENITSQKEAEQNVRAALKKEKELNSLKSRFVSMASHEFRTPLSTILSSVTLIEKYTAPFELDKANRHVNRIKSAVSNLTNILNDFLSLSKLEEGIFQFSPTPISLVEFCNELKEEMQQQAKHGQKIIYNHQGDEEMLKTDPQVLKNILHNLLSNAIKYSEEDKEVHLSTSIQDGQTAIEVRDQGIGIPEEDQHLMFNRFFRAKNTLNMEGTGLGLNIVKGYVELMNGTISFESKENEGSLFRVVLPN